VERHGGGVAALEFGVPSVSPTESDREPHSPFFLFSYSTQKRNI
jgi:hypothetical protein